MIVVISCLTGDRVVLTNSEPGPREKLGRDRR